MKFKVQEIVEAALLIALAAVLELIEIPIPGGHLSLSFVPLLVIALRNNAFKTFVFCGLCYGTLDCFLDGYGWATYPLEYVVALGSFAIISLVRGLLFNHQKQPVKEILILVFFFFLHFVVRMTCSTIDSIVIYDYEFVPAFMYNLTNLGFDALLTIGVGGLIYFPLRTLNIQKYNLEKYGR